MHERFEDFNENISRLYYALVRIKALGVKEYGLMAKDVTCIYHLFQHPDGLTSKELTELSKEDKAAVSRVVKKLRNDGIVEKEKSDKIYRNKIFLSAKGKEIGVKIMERIKIAAQEIGNDLSQTQREAFYATLAHLADKMEEYNF